MKDKEKKDKKAKKPTKKFNYFKSFKEMSVNIVDATKLLDDSLNNYNIRENFAARIPDMRRLEHANDEIVYEVMNYIATDFITPIDREDLIAIVQGLDDVIDAIDEVFTYIYIYHIDLLRPEILDMTSNLIRCAVALNKVTEEFQNLQKSKNLKEYVIDISDLEKDNDEIFTRAMYNLFESTHESARELLTWRDMYERLEDCADACETVAHLMEGAVLKIS